MRSATSEAERLADSLERQRMMDLVPGVCNSLFEGERSADGAGGETLGEC